ncbi:MAG: ribonuclease III [Chlorobiaceae bacterium]
MEPFWQKIITFAFHRPEEIKDCQALASSAFALKTIEFLRGVVEEPETNLKLYLTALTHRSALHDSAHLHLIESNQRLEFLGDSVIGLLISAYLFKKFPNNAEGELSNKRAKIVNRNSLAGFAMTLGLGEYILIGESADRHKICCNESALADAFESLIGAIYLDKGIHAANNFIIKHVIEHVNFNTIVFAEHNYKSRLIEYTQLHHLPPPLYSIIEEAGVEHEKTFTVGVTCTDQLLGTGTAKRKKDAEQLAAREAIKLLATS